MEGYAVLMLVFAGCPFLYAGLLAKTKSIRLLPRSDAVKVKNKEQYAENAAKMIALAALAPLASALVARIADAALPALLVFAGGLVLLLWLGTRLLKGGGTSN